jgi:hypothetical protein
MEDRQPIHQRNPGGCKCNNVNACNPTPLLYIHLKPVGKPIFRIKVLADTGATQSLISLSTAAKHRCEIKETFIELRAANGTKIDVAGTTSLQVVEKGHLVHTIVALVSIRTEYNEARHDFGPNIVRAKSYHEKMG